MLKSSVENSWFQHWQRKKQPRIRLFCFPYAGGSAAIFHPWSALLPPEIEVCPVQLPGREQRLSETAFSRIPPLIDALVDVLSPYLDRPYAFFGHSMGALISFELARRLYQTGQGAELAHLFVSGHRAPHVPDPDPPTYHLPEEAFIAELRRLQGTPESLLQNKELLHLFIPLLRADFALCETYTYVNGNPLSCPITVFGGLQDKEVSLRALSRWKEQTTGTWFKLRLLDGDHFFLHTKQDALLQTLAQDLCDA